MFVIDFWSSLLVALQDYSDNILQVFSPIIHLEDLYWKMKNGV